MTAREMRRAFPVGSRVELHPANGLWMMGARFGEVTKVGRTYVYVRLDRIGQTVALRPRDIGEVIA